MSDAAPPTRPSDAAPALIDSPLDINLCTQCGEVIPRDGVPQSRHAIPCGHVFCGGCVGKAAAEQKSGPVACVCRGCAQELAPVAEFTVVAWCTQRRHRLDAELALRLGDQGDARADSGPADANVDLEPAEHGHESKAEVSDAEGKARLHAADSDPQAALAGMIRAALTQAKLDPTADRQRIVRWAAEATAQVKSWEQQLLDWTRASAATACGLIEEVRTLRLEGYRSMALQRLSLRVSFDEIEVAMASPVSDGGDRRSKRERLASDWAKLVAALDSGSIKVPPTGVLGLWSELPKLDREFSQTTDEIVSEADRISQPDDDVSGLEEEDEDDSGTDSAGASEEKDEDDSDTDAAGAGEEKDEHDSDTDTAGASEEEESKHTSTMDLGRGEEDGEDKGDRDQFLVMRAFSVVRAVRRRLAGLRDDRPSQMHIWPLRQLYPRGGAPMFSVMPDLDLSKPPVTMDVNIPANDPDRRISAFIPLDAEKVVVAIDREPLRVWALPSRSAVCIFEGTEFDCGLPCQVVLLPFGRVAYLNWRAARGRGDYPPGIAILDMRTAKLLQHISHDTLQDNYVGMIYVDGHLIAGSASELVVWELTKSGEFVQKLIIYSDRRDFRGEPVPLSSSTLAIVAGRSSAPPPYGGGRGYHVEVWDWHQDELLQTISGFGNAPPVIAALPDGRLVVGTVKGEVWIGNPKTWDAALSFRNGLTPIRSIKTTLDGALLIGDGEQVERQIRIWRNGVCEATLKGTGPLAIVGSRLLGITRDGASVLVFE